MKKQAMVLFTFVFLAMTCISCSSNKVTSADDQLSSSEESASNSDSAVEGSTSSNEKADGEVSEAAQDKAAALLGSNDSSTTAEASEVKLDSNPLALGMESSGGLLDSSASTILAQADTKPADAAAPTLLTAPVVDSEATMKFDGSNNTPEASASSNSENSVAPEKAVKKHFKKSVKSDAPVKKEEAPKQETRTPAAAPSAPQKAVAQADVDEALEPIPAVAGEEKVEPKLASAEISTFIERHVFLVTVGVVGFVFALFIIMRRNKGREDHLSM